MLHKFFVCLCFGLIFPSFLVAQQTAVYTNDLEQYGQALNLYNNHQYKAAQTLFRKVKREGDESVQADCSYYIASSAVRLQQSNAEDLMEDFVQNYPTSPKRNSAYLNVANYYFDTGNYKDARKWFSKVDESSLGRKEEEDFNFKNGYAYYKAGNTDKAKEYLNRVRDSEEYGSKATYYLGFMAYEGDNYQEANQMFDQVKEDKRYNRNLSYFQSDMNFKSGKFEEAIRLGKEQLPKSNARERSELNKIIGESYFNLEQYSEAIPYLKKYRGKRGRLTNTDYYQLGFAYYKQGEYENAVSQFNKIINGKSFVAQNAYYHLAEAYSQLGQKQQALNAFKNASEMDFEPKLKEDAALNYAKLSYEIGNNYKSIPEVLTDFLKTYPDSPKRDEIKALLIDSYITSKNYKAAMNALENSHQSSDRRAYQKVAYYRGVELYNEGEYTQALNNFDKSLAEKIEPVITAQATFWKAESNFNLSNFQKALEGYQTFKAFPAASKTAIYKSIDYSIGYANFKLHNYDQAIQDFKAYTATNVAGETPEQKNDAFLRLGDSYFAKSDYWKSMEAYNKAIAMKGVDSDYAYFQKAISYGFVDRNNKKIDDLKAFLSRYSKSVYRDDALYELGNTYLAENNTKAALQAYDRLIAEIPMSSFVSKALLKEGLVYYNDNKNDEALGKFKKVVADYPNTQQAAQAVKTARNVYIDLGRTDEYASWIKGLDFVKVSASDIENATFESAENQKVENKNQKASEGYKKYINEFPNGSHITAAHFNLAKLQYRSGDHQKAKVNFEYVTDQPRDEFTEPSLARLSQIYLEDENYKKAIPVLQRLEREAEFPQNTTFAQSNLMKAYYQQDDYSQAVSYAEKVLQNPKAEPNAKNDAHIFIARSALKTGDETKAKKAYAEVQKTAHGKLGAEALYYEAYFKRKAGELKASNDAVQQLAKDYSGYKKYGGKGLLLMAKNFYDLKDAYQATYILENINKNFGDYPDLIEEAKATSKRIKSQEAKTNASVKTENN